jgi:hypothetical protein
MRDLKGDASRVEFIHWGTHRASNDFRETSNIILAGTQFLPMSVYEGIGRAASGLLPAEGEITDRLQTEIEHGELADLILQAVCRGSARKARGDRCPPCHVYIIARPVTGVRKLLPDIFPGCTIETWEPGPHRLTGKARKAFDFIVRWFDEHPADLLPVEDVMKAIDETDRANFNKNVRKHAGFKRHITDAGIYEVRGGRKCLGFRQELEEPSYSVEEMFPGAQSEAPHPASLW